MAKMAKIAKTAPSSMANILSPTYRKRPNFVTQRDFWDHFLHFGITFWGSDRTFFQKYLRKGSLFAILGSFFWPRSHFLGPKSADLSPRSNLSKLDQIAKIAVFTYEKGPFSPQIALFGPKMRSQRSKNDPKWQKMIPLLFLLLYFFFALFP
jgi:hypothetical protein